jgi:hypothetical protein
LASAIVPADGFSGKCGGGIADVEFAHSGGESTLL